MADYTAPPLVPVDEVAVCARAGTFTRRSIKKEAKEAVLDLIVRMIDLTTLEGMDTEGKVKALCRKALCPQPGSDAPPVAAVCVYPTFVRLARKQLTGTPVRVASVATAFPSGQSPLEIRVAEVKSVVKDGADEVDMVINRGAYLSGKHQVVHDEIVRVKEACGRAHLKVILETSELGTLQDVRRASRIAMDAGADFIKTSTGKLAQAASLPVTLVMLEAIRDYYLETGRAVGMKPAGGIKTAKQAWQYLVMLNETLGDGWMNADRFRIGASSLLNDVLMQRQRLRKGSYSAAYDFSEA